MPLVDISFLKGITVYVLFCVEGVSAATAVLISLCQSDVCSALCDVLSHEHAMAAVPLMACTIEAHEFRHSASD